MSTWHTSLESSHLFNLCKFPVLFYWNLQSSISSSPLKVCPAFTRPHQKTYCLMVIKTVGNSVPRSHVLLLLTFLWHLKTRFLVLVNEQLWLPYVLRPAGRQWHCLCHTQFLPPLDQFWNIHTDSTTKEKAKQQFLWWSWNERKWCREWVNIHVFRLIHDIFICCILYLFFSITSIRYRPMHVLLTTMTKKLKIGNESFLPFQLWEMVPRIETLTSNSLFESIVYKITALLKALWERN